MDNNKKQYKNFCDAFLYDAKNKLIDAIDIFFENDSRINIVEPVNEIQGKEELIYKFFSPMLNSFPDLYRRTDIFFSGIFEDQEWVTSSGHFVGTFTNNWMGIPANNQLTYLRYGEFHRMKNNKAVETFLFFDLIDLLRQIDKWPLKINSLGNEQFVPGPITSDGILLANQDSLQTKKSLIMVEEMLKNLYTKKQTWRKYWHPNMMWYGPSGYGSYIGVDGFASFQLPYESVFDTYRKGTFSMTCEKESKLDLAVKGHFARFSEGNFVASGGWPSHGGHLCKDWLGIKANGQQFTCRVSDWWRREGNLLIENWVFVDLIDMLKQLDYDVFKETNIQLQL